MTTTLLDHVEETSRPNGGNDVGLLTQDRGENRPAERAVDPMTKHTPRVHTRTGTKTSSCDAGLAAGTVVLTLDGEIPVEFLNPGDRIITRRGVRKLKAVALHTLPAGTPREVLSADAMGGKPAKAITLLPGQRVVIRDWRAQALWNRDIAVPQAARLVDGEFIRHEDGGEQIMLSLYFGAPEIIYADGLELGSADKPRAAAPQQAKAA